MGVIARLTRLPVEGLLLPFVLVLALGVRGTNQWLESRQIETVADGDVGVLPNGNAVRIASLGFARLAADLFWIRTTYYVGDPVASAAKWPAAERLTNLITDIDPHYDSVYVLMASVLGGLAGNVDGAIRVLEKGAQNSNYWRIHFLLGFQYFMEKEDYVRGAQCLERAYALGGPPYLPYLVARLYTSAGDPETALEFISARLKNEENPDVRVQLEKRFSDVWINRDLAAIDAAIAKQLEAKRSAPKNVRELVAGGFLGALPHDPQGGEYFIADGKAATHLEYQVLKLNLPGLRKHGEKQP